MTSDEQLSFLIYTNIITLCLWIASEIIGASKCEYNGVIQIVISGISCMKDRTIEVEINFPPAPPIDEERPLLA